MRADHQAPRRDHTPPGGVAAGVGAALAVIACCAGPGLIAAGTLGALGSILGNPWVITTAALALVATAAAVLWRRHTGVSRRCSVRPEDRDRCGRDG